MGGLGDDFAQSDLAVGEEHDLAGVPDQRRDVRDLMRKAGITAATHQVSAGHPVLSELAPGERSYPGGFVAEVPASGGAKGGRSGGRSTGSASGGMTIALNAIGEDLRSLAVEQGYSLESLHRVTAMASGGLDSMPHNGAVITLLLVCGMTHRESYKDVAMITLVIPVLAVAVIVLGALAVG